VVASLEIKQEKEKISCLILVIKKKELPLLGSNFFPEIPID
jgi:hypothetical protein